MDSYSSLNIGFPQKVVNILFPSALLHISIVRREGFSANWRVRGGSFTRLCSAEGLISNWVSTKKSAFLITGTRCENHAWSKIWNILMHHPGVRTSERVGIQIRGRDFLEFGWKRGVCCSAGPYLHTSRQQVGCIIKYRYQQVTQKQSWQVGGWN